MAGKPNILTFPSAPAGGDRLRTFMRRFGFQNSHDVAQAFRVSQTTASRWMKDTAESSVDDVMPGPAVILLELMESGIETPDLKVAQFLASVRESPGDYSVIEGELQWRIEMSRSARHGAKIVIATGQYMIVHSVWFRERIKRLSNEAGRNGKVARELVSRYADTMKKLAELPR